MNVETLRELLRYHYWAAGRILEKLEKLTPEQFTQPVVSSFPSIRDTCAHLVGAEVRWWGRWKGEPVPPDAPEFFTSPRAVREAWAASRLRWEAAAAALTAADMEALVPSTITYPLHVVIQHMVNHASYHRGQLITLLRQIGGETVGMDYILIDAPYRVSVEHLRWLLDYHYWASHRLIEKVLKLTQEQWERPLVSSFPSIQRTCTHFVQAEQAWSNLWLGRPRLQLEPYPTPAEWQQAWAEYEARWRGLLAELREDEVGVLVTHPIYGPHQRSKLVRQIVNHASYHRGQMTTLLRQVGGETVSFDLVRYYGESRG